MALFSFERKGLPVTSNAVARQAIEAAFGGQIPDDLMPIGPAIAFPHELLFQADLPRRIERKRDRDGGLEFRCGRRGEFMLVSDESGVG